MNPNKENTLSFIEKACELLKNSKSFFEIKIKGKTTNIKISKEDKEDEKTSSH